MIRLLYIGIVILANIVTSIIQPFQFAEFIIPAGTIFIGLTFLIRDYLQTKYGRTNIYKYILLSTIIGIGYSVFINDMLIITIASCIAFFISESVDTEIFTRYSGSIYKKMIYSGVVGGLFDSVIFVIIGLSPLFTNILSWDIVIYGILGQYIVKCLVQLIYVGGLYGIKTKWCNLCDALK
jgi:uncharacterized PurR-regulated membrane protein YhhQ (DUF165 family)